MLSVMLLAGCASLDGRGFAPDRPGFADGPATVPAGHVEASGGAHLATGGGATYADVGQALVRAGVLSSVELRLAPGGFLLGDRQGLQDVSIGGKLAVFDRSASALALLAATTLPTGGAETGGGVAVPELALLYGRSAGPWSLGGNVRLSFPPVQDGTRDAVTTLVAAAARSLSDRLSTFADLVAAGVGGDAGSDIFLDGGVALVVRPGLQLDGWAAVGPFGAGTEYLFGVGIAAQW